MQTYLFVGGQYHGQMLPVCEEALLEAELGREHALRASANGRYYPGYSMNRLDFLGNGARLIAVHRATRGATDTRLSLHVCEAFSIALDNHARVLDKYRRKGRFTPLNAQLEDEPGTPAKRRHDRTKLEI